MNNKVKINNVGKTQEILMGGSMLCVYVGGLKFILLLL